MSEKLTKEEIARQFELPERKSKLASLFKQDQKINCICNSAIPSHFVVPCDSCGNYFHGNCIGISEKEFSNTLGFVCEYCKEDETSSFREKAYKSNADVKYNGPINNPENSSDPPYIPSMKKENCGSCANCSRSKNCGSCSACKSLKKGSKKKKKRCIHRSCVSLIKGEKTKHSQTKNPKEKSSSESENVQKYLYTPGMQCYGPGCVETAKKSSKYCSDKCGMKLATNRILHILPQRLQDWKINSSIADINDRKKLEEIRKRQFEIKKRLDKMSDDYRKLEEIIRAGNNLRAKDFDLEKIRRWKGKLTKGLLDKNEEDSSIYCITCGQEIHTSTAVKHMEKCFLKHESHSSFGSSYEPTMIDGRSIFCDSFNPGNGTFCKRLKVLCPEHMKEPMGPEDDACGCPVIKSVFHDQDKAELCRYPKKYCGQHYGWERMRRAEADGELLRQWVSSSNRVISYYNLQINFNYSVLFKYKLLLLIIRFCLFLTLFIGLFNKPQSNRKHFINP